MLNTFIFLLLGGGFLPAPGGNLLLWLFGGVFFSGVARSFIPPSHFSLLPRIVAHAELPAASAWLSSGFQIATIAGPAVAGLVYGGYGPRGAWIIPVFMMVMAFLLSGLIRLPPHPRTGEKREKAVKSIAAGWSFILKHPILLSVMSLDMFAVLFGGAVAMLPAYADRILHVGAEGLGALRAAPALGAVAMALMLAFNPLKRISAMQLLCVVSGFGLCMIGFGLSTSYWLSMALLILSGLFDSVSMVIRSTIMQLSTPDHMRGRVSSINSMFIISSNELGAFESGLAAKFLGLVPSVVFGGIGTLVVVAAVAGLSPQFRKTVINVHELKNGEPPTA
jgi:MFS family permease